MPRFRFRGDMPFEKWQSAARDRLKSLLCMPQNRGECRADALTRKLHDGFIEYRFQVETESNFYTQCYLLTPDDKKEAHKLCICFGGHGSNMHITAGLPDNDVNRAKGELCALENKRILSENPELGMAKFALEAGRAALVIESRGFGEAGDDEPSCTENAKTALLMGRTLMGERVHDAVCVLDAVLKECEPFLRESEWFYPEDIATDQPERAMAAEIIREKVLRTTNKEIPHGVAVVIEKFTEDPKTGMISIFAAIYCERNSHKGIIVGKGGEGLKRIGSYARQDLEKLLGAKVYLNLWVKVKENWRESAAAVTNFGYNDN